MKICGDKKIICADATHGTNSYNFLLISVLVFGEGFPAGWCISNKEDCILLSNFFTHLREKTGPIFPEWFMSDMAEQYFTSWVNVYGGKPKKLLCTWHVDWINNLYRIHNKDLQTAAYHMLRVLLEEMDTVKFHKLLQETLNEWKGNEMTLDFSDYFYQYYAQKPHEWAGCYRKRACINTNMYAESFHRVLKHVYLKGRVNKRMDLCINVLLRYARDKAFDRILKLEKGKSTKRNNAILHRHKLSLSLPTSLVTSQGNDEWTVQSSTNSKITYTVAKHEGCQKDCWIRCPTCCVCIHSFTCTCPDSLLHGIICKHVHLVIRSNETTEQIDSEKKNYHHIKQFSDSNNILLSSVQNQSRLEGYKINYT